MKYIKIKILGYGLTETSPITHLQRKDTKPVLGGCGWPVPNTECRVVEVDTEAPLGANNQGHIQIRGPQVMLGYHRNEEATRQTIDFDGWLRTGDIGYYDEEGQFFITDRLKELIKVKGYQVAPAELEALLRTHPAVRDAAVIGITHPADGERPKAFIVLRPHISPTSAIDSIHEFVNSRVTKYKRLNGGIEFIDTIPRNPSGKILRRSLK